MGEVVSTSGTQVPCTAQGKAAHVSLNTHWGTLNELFSNSTALIIAELISYGFPP